jgi:HD-like signal output (HDOD) protein
MPQETDTPARPLRLSSDIGREIDQARQQGGLRRIEIPPCPALLTRLQAVMRADDPDLTEVARIAASDVAMSVRLLQAANSPAFTSGQGVSTVGHAIGRMGLKQTAAVLAGYLVQRAVPAQNRHLDRFWERSRQRAEWLAFIARHLPGLSPDLAHTYGLFCHVGLPVLLQGLRGYGATLVEAAARLDRDMVALENERHHTDHAVVGALVARVWQLDPAVMAAIRLHHDLNSLGRASTEPEVQTLVAAGVVADHLQRRHEGLSPDRDWLAHGQAALDWLHVGEEDLVIWEEELSALPALA